MKKNQACFFAWIVHVPSVEIELKWKNLDAQMSIKINHEHVQIIESMANKQSLKGRWQKTSPKVAWHTTEDMLRPTRIASFQTTNCFAKTIARVKLMNWDFPAVTIFGKGSRVSWIARHIRLVWTVEMSLCWLLQQQMFLGRQMHCIWHKSSETGDLVKNDSSDVDPCFCSLGSFSLIHRHCGHQSWPIGHIWNNSVRCALHLGGEKTNATGQVSHWNAPMAFGSSHTKQQKNSKISHDLWWLRPRSKTSQRVRTMFTRRNTCTHIVHSETHQFAHGTLKPI